MRIDEFVNNEKLTELQKPNTRGLAGALLKKNGYEKIGKGSFASVWGKPGEDFLIKIFDNGDNAYQGFVNLISSNNNDHFPKLKGKMTKINEKYSGIRIERLTPMSEAQFLKMGLAPVYKYLTYMADGDRSGLSQDQINTTLQQIDELEKSQPGMKAALDLIAKNLGSYIFDTQPANFMLRGNTVVITDPVA